MNTTTHTTVRRVATTAVLAGAAVLSAAPTYADTVPAPAAVDPGSSLTYLSSLTRSAHGTTYRLDGLYSAGAAVLAADPGFAGVPEDAGAGPAASPNKAQVEHQESAGVSGGMSAQTKAKVEQMERAARDQQPASRPAGSSSNPSDPSSVPGTMLALLGGTLVAGAAGYTVYRFRHHGPVGAATA